MNRKTLLSTLGVILLGALGSGLWELLKPLLNWGWSGLLTISTLGLTSLRDGIYANAAGDKSVGIAVAVQTLSSLTMLTGAAIIGYIRISFRPPSHPMAKLYYFSLLMGAVAFLVAGSRTAYVSQLASYSTKLEIIAAPHISENELKQLRAKSVQIDNRASYLAYIATLREKIEAAGEKAPTRNFF